MSLVRRSGCKVNLLLNILAKREDGFHELETVLHPVSLHDELTFEKGVRGVRLKCDRTDLPTGRSNLVVRAAMLFFEATGIKGGVRVHLSKRVPVAGGLGGGSANAAVTLAALNELFETGLDTNRLCDLAARLGSDVPFFIQNKPAIGVGRGEQLNLCGSFIALRQHWMLLIQPGFGISTAWAYRALAGFPDAAQGRPGRAGELVRLLGRPDFSKAAPHFYNALEAPAFEKYPWLAVLKQFMMDQGASAALMSGSGSTSFAILDGKARAETLADALRAKFGGSNWISIVPCLDEACA